MVGVCIIIITGLAAAAAWWLLCRLIRPMNWRRKKFTSDFLEVEKKLEKQLARKQMYNKLISRLMQYVHLSFSDREDFQLLIDRLELNMKPEYMRAQQVAVFMSTAILSAVFVTINSFFLILAVPVLVMGWVFPIKYYEENLEKAEQEILWELPDFFSVVYYAYLRSTDTHLSEVILDYLPSAGKYFRHELEVMLDNIEEGEKYALRLLKKRVPVIEIVKFCDIMLLRLDNYDNRARMGYFKEELQLLKKDRLMKKLAKKEKWTYAVTLVLIGELVVFALLHLLFQSMGSIQMLINF